MDQPTHYCQYVSNLPQDNLHKIYHDTQYGRPINEDNQLFELLILEINQAGLSWNTILQKRKNFYLAYDNFHLPTVAQYGEKEINRLLGDSGIIRNRMKINAAIHNAQIITNLVGEYGSFKNWLDEHHPLSHQEWTKLFRSTFKFTGPEIVKEFLMSSGYLEGAHTTDCPIYQDILSHHPPWTRV